EAREAIQRRREAAELERLMDEERPQRLERARELLVAALPGEPSTLELHATLRLLASESGIELENIQFGRLVELNAPFFDARAARLEVRVGGRGTPAELVALIGALDTLDRPIRAFELGLSRADSSGADYALRLGVGAYCVLPGRSMVSDEPLAAPEGETP
ncbi:MAG TPA: hypothetical protein PKD61_31585, partial [Polyangiaceae bacterium]|nr:hypothetical protein [Polyangiaceae bacterium]